MFLISGSNPTQTHTTSVIGSKEFGNTSSYLLLEIILPDIYYIKNKQDATLGVLFISNCKITLHVSDAFCVHHQE